MMRQGPLRVALYARVSTRNNGQNPETQLIPLRQYATARGFQIAGEYVDVGVSGAKDQRPRLNWLMVDARQRKFDVVVVARFDRFARSTRHLVLALEEFNALGIDFISLSESIDTSTPMGKLVFTVIAGVAELERSLIRERVMMGLSRARAEGKRLGRPLEGPGCDQVLELQRQGMSQRQISARLGISKTTVLRRLAWRS